MKFKSVRVCLSLVFVTGTVFAFGTNSVSNPLSLDPILGSNGNAIAYSPVGPNNSPADPSYPPHNPTHPPADPNHPPSQNSALHGHYTLIKRECLNGQPTRDRFVVGRDEMSVTFHNGEYISKTRVLNCYGIAFGKFVTRENLLQTFDNYSSDCANPVRAIPQFDYVLGGDDNEITISSYTGVNGACYNDYIKVTLRKEHKHSEP